MLLESLANELLLDLFEFLDGIDLLRAFGGLNCRFETLLHRYVLDYHLDFRFVSKRDFDQHLKSLNVSQVSGAQESKLLNIINRAPSLYSLTIPDKLALGLMRLTITNTSIRQLYIRHSYAFNVSDCSELAHSSLGRQCEVLSITVESRDNVLYLINNMSNLRALRFNIDVQIENNDVKKSQADTMDQ
ncbi:hypothetical protein I4U23_022686 [Adineta vaga]|nr:hypothetical protein I4U23_022686 [Adineta vaga]